MSLELKPQTESILIQEAAREGVSVDELLTHHFAPVKSKNGAATATAIERAQPKRLRGQGMLAGILSTEDFLRRKRDETEREDRRRQ